MRALSGLDAGFLYIETPETPMHVGSLSIFQLPDDLLLTPDPLSKFTARVIAHFKDRLMLAPILHQRLALMPFDLGHPVWVDAPDVDLPAHVQSHQLKKARSGTRMQALENLVAELHAQPLERDRPLWQFHVISGFADGEIALYSKVHHAALDGAAGVALANAILDLSPEGRAPSAVAAATKSAKAAPTRSKLLGALFSNTLAQYAKIARAIPGAVKKVANAAYESGAGGIGGAISGAINTAISASKQLLAPKTRFNAQISAERSYRTLALPLKELKAIAAALDVSLNDVVLCLCSGALRRYLLANKELPQKSLVAAVPLSLRESGDTRSNNQVTMLPATLGTDAKTPELRLQKIKAAMNALKSTSADMKSLIPTDYPSLGSPWLVAGLAQLYSRSKLADRIALPVNLVISNVPGPRVPLYLAGAKMLAYYPVSIIVHGLALNITVHSYVDSLDIGLVACPVAVPDLDTVIEALGQEHQALKALAASVLLGKGAASTQRTKARPSPPAQAEAKASKAATKLQKAPAQRAASASKQKPKPKRAAARRAAAGRKS
jgi:diacylglycerol O-acyltransferase / wax synthase